MNVLIAELAYQLVPPDAIYEDEDECIEAEGDDESVKKNYEFFGEEWDG